MSTINLYDSPVATVSINDQGIYIFKLKDTNHSFDIVEAKNFYKFFNEHSKGEPFKLIVDTTDSLNLPKDDAAIHFRITNDVKNKIAIIATAIPIRLFMGQTLKFRKIENAKVFKTEEEAIKWLLEEDDA